MKNLTLIILITFHTSLFTIHTLSQPCLPEGIEFTSQAQIDSFQINYPNCIIIEGDLEISGSDISNLYGLNGITSVEGNLIVSDNDILSDLSGLENLTSIGANLSIGSYWTVITPVPMWHCYNNPSLSSLNGLDNLVSIGGNLEVYGNDILTDLSNLANVTTIDGNLLIGTNPGWFCNNPSLSSLTGLENISAASIDSLYICFNASLANCEVQSICDYLASPNGTIEIVGNASGCDSQQEVEEACWTSIEKAGFENVFTISPNPIESTTLIEYTLLQNSPVTLKILDLSGREMLTLATEVQQQGEQQVVFNTVDLPAGIYFCVLKTSVRILTTKMIKL